MVSEKLTVTEITARSSNGYNFIKGKLYSCGKPKFAVQILHGMTEHIERYQEFIEYLCTELSCACFAHDCCGHGASVFDSNEYGFIAARKGYKYVVNDTYGFLQETRKYIGDIPVFLFGYDMGSYVARLAVSQFSESYCGLIVCGTSFRTLGQKLLLKKCKNEISLNGETYLSTELYDILVRSYNQKFEGRTDVDWLSSDPNEVDNYIKDPICGFKFTVSATKDFVKLRIDSNTNEWFKTLPNIPVFILSGANDPVGRFSKDAKKIAAKLKKSGKTDVEVKLYNNARHDLIHEKCRAQVFADVKTWIIAHT